MTATDFERLRAIVEARRDHIAPQGSPASTRRTAPEKADDQRSRVIVASEVTPERVSWLWHGRLPVGKLVVIDGDPGTGKTTAALDLGARVSTGAPWPDGAAGVGPGGVLVVSLEDGLADTLVPRLTAAQADLDRCYFLTEVAEGDGWRLPRIPDDVRILRDRITEHEVRLVILDPLAAILSPSVSMNRDQDVRGALAPLARVAERTRSCIVVIRHLKKGAESNALYRGGGSIGVIGAARVGIVVAIDPADPERRALGVYKGNLAKPAPTLSFELIDDPDLGCARVAWGTATSATGADLLDGPSSEDERSTLSEAERWLEDTLSGGVTMLSANVKRDATRAGFSEASIKRAAKNLGVTIASEGFPRCTTWTLGNADHSQLTATAPTVGSPSVSGLHFPLNRAVSTSTSGADPEQSAHTNAHEPTAPSGTRFDAECRACGSALGAAAYVIGDRSFCNDTCADRRP